MKSGIYYIRNSQTNKLYIGSSKDIDKRFRQHKNALKNGKHINIHLQRAYNLYGESSFEYGIMEETSDLFIREEFYIKQVDANDLYNLGTIGGGDNTSQHPNKAEFIERMRQKILSNYKNASNEKRLELSARMTGENNPNYGNKWNTIQRNEASTKVRNRYETHPEIGEKISKTLKEKWAAIDESERIRLSPRIRRIRIGDAVFCGMNHAAKETGLNPYTIRYRAGSEHFPEYSFID